MHGRIAAVTNDSSDRIRTLYYPLHSHGDRGKPWETSVRRVMISTKYFQNTVNFMLFIICIFLHSIFKTCIIKHGSFPEVKCGQGVLSTTHPLLVPRSWKSRAIPLPILWGKPGLWRDHFTFFMIISCWIMLIMRNVSDETRTESKNTFFMFNNVFTKILPFVRRCGKIRYRQEGHRRAG